ncbi:MAG TPA: DUF2254 family protein, partial [Pseudoneobacillus sp.]|nr:DUF2254 family protein [Pseudoneobacillus sp.]
AHFIHHVATFIQVSNLIVLLTEDVLKIVESKISLVEQQEHVFLLKDIYLIPPSYKMKTDIYSKKYGYLQLLDYNELLRLAVKNNQIIEINQKIGQFITQNHSILTVYHQKEALLEDYQPIITVGRERTTMQNEEFALRKIVEITLRAISPAINDPNTAIDCIHHLGLALGEVCRLDGHYLIYNDYQSKARVIVPQKPFQEILYLTFYQISYYGREDISVILAILEALKIIVEKGSKEIKRIVWGFSHYILEGVNFEQLRQLDQKNIQDKISGLKKLCQTD